MFNLNHGALYGMSVANHLAVQQSPAAWLPSQFPPLFVPQAPPTTFDQAFPLPFPTGAPTTPQRNNGVSTPLGSPANSVAAHSTTDSATAVSPSTSPPASPVAAAANANTNAAAPPTPVVVNAEGLVLQPRTRRAPRINQSQLTNFVLGLNLKGKPENTVKAFNPKIQEFFSFCECQCADDPSKMHHLNYDKAYRFMFYQCFREKKKVGGKKTDEGSAGDFDVEAYNKAMKHFVDKSQDGDAAADFPTPADPVGISVHTQYIAVFRLLHKKEDADGTI